MTSPRCGSHPHGYRRLAVGVVLIAASCLPMVGCEHFLARAPRVRPGSDVAVVNTPDQYDLVGTLLDVCTWAQDTATARQRGSLQCGATRDSVALGSPRIVPQRIP